MRPLRPLVCAFGLLVLSACARVDNGEVEKLKKERDAARAEAEAAKAELAALKSSVVPTVSLPANPLAGSPATDGKDEEQVRAVGQGFVDDVEHNRLASAYRSTSAEYQKQTDRKSFDAVIEKHAVKTLEVIQNRQYKVRKAADGKGYEFYATARELNSRQPNGPQAFSRDSAGVGPRINIALALVPEGGAWRVNEVEIVVEK